MGDGGCVMASSIDHRSHEVESLGASFDIEPVHKAPLCVHHGLALTVSTTGLRVVFRLCSLGCRGRKNGFLHFRLRLVA
jgi:hypothetical protein